MTVTSPLVFIITSLILIITPGQDMILVMSRSISQGWKAGVATASGVSVGLLGHTVLATLGLGALLSASEILFMIIKLIGAAYLLYLGIALLRNNHAGLDISSLPTASLRKLFFQGVISNLSNPKIAIFYFAYLPQFIPAGAENPTFLILMLGASFAMLTFLVKGPIGYGAGILSSWLRTRPAMLGWINRLSGVVLITLGLRLAFERRN
ncbi:MAG: LysE family translocator [Deltaproteobacteria bacterium]|nr:LysE family translocator [Deltaproteobacteria bacterium]